MADCDGSDEAVVQSLKKADAEAGPTDILQKAVHESGPVDPLKKADGEGATGGGGGGEDSPKNSYVDGEGVGVGSSEGGAAASPMKKSDADGTGESRAAGTSEAETADSRQKFDGVTSEGAASSPKKLDCEAGAAHSLLRLDQHKIVSNSLNSIFNIQITLSDDRQIVQRYKARLRELHPAQPKGKKGAQAEKTPATPTKKGKTAASTVASQADDAKPKISRPTRKRKGAASPVASQPQDEKLENSSRTRKGKIAPSTLVSGQIDAKFRIATGFAIAISPDKDRLRILTCAHSIDEIYANGHHDLKLDDINDFYDFAVVCAHQELRVREQLDGKPIDEQFRHPTLATVVAVDTKKDLMVLEIFIDEIYLGEEREQEIICEHDHPVITSAGPNLSGMEWYILQGWPPQCIQSIGTGQLSCEARSYEAITQLNPKGYDMKLVEFTNRLGDEGSSGGPVLNGETKFVGVYYGDMKGTKGYAVSAEVVDKFLEEFDMLTVWS